MAFVASDDDTVALAELAHLHPEHAEFGRWCPLCLTPPTLGRTRGWASDPLVSGLVELRGLAKLCTPTETVEEVTSQLGLAGSSNGRDPRTPSKLDSFASCWGGITILCFSKPATLSGSLKFLADADSAGGENFGDDVVNVLTYHKAKGPRNGRQLYWQASTLMLQQNRGVWLSRASPRLTSGTPSPGGGSAFGRGRLVARASSRSPPGARPCPRRPAGGLKRRQADSARVLYVGLTRSVSVTCLTSISRPRASLNTLASGPIVEWTARRAGNEGNYDSPGPRATASTHLSLEVFSYEPADGPTTDFEKHRAGNSKRSGH